MDRLSLYGIEIDVPSGWEAQLSVQQDPAGIDPHLVPSSRPLVVLHVANFWIPAECGDYGLEVAEVMGPQDIFVSLVEFDPTSVGSPLFTHVGIPLPLSPDDFDPGQLHRPMRSLAGVQRFFSSAGRAFCLHAVVGSHNRRGVLTPEVNRILSGLTIRQQSGVV